MGLETGSFVADLVLTNPAATDLVSEGDDHLRLLKAVLQGTFPGMGGIYRRVDARSTGYTVLTTDNTKHFVIDASATTTVTLSLPAAASITSGFSIMVTALTGATVLIDGAGAEQINGAATLSLGDRNAAHVFYMGSSAWRANTAPTGQSGFVFHEGVAFSATVSVNSSPLHLNSGQLQFPAAQNASSDANTLDDYEEGDWTPTLTFDTPGDLSTVFSSQSGKYTKVGRQVHCEMFMVTTTFTHTTAAGALRVGGVPFTQLTGIEHAGTLSRSEGLRSTNASWLSILREGAVTSTFVIRTNRVSASLGTSGSVDAAEQSSGENKVISAAVTFFV